MSGNYVYNILEYINKKWRRPRLNIIILVLACSPLASPERAAAAPCLARRVSCIGLTSKETDMMWCRVNSSESIVSMEYWDCSHLGKVSDLMTETSTPRQVWDRKLCGLFTPDSFPTLLSLSDWEHSAGGDGGSRPASLVLTLRERERERAVCILHRLFVIWYHPPPAPDVTLILILILILIWSPDCG